MNQKVKAAGRGINDDQQVGAAHSATPMDDNITVVARVRPLNARERGQPICLTIDPASNAVTVASKPNPTQFSFDHVVPEDSPQSDIFRDVGRPLTDACLQGFNGTILAYGQTGSGKTHTLFGGSDEASKGLVPRVLEYLWSQIALAEAAHSGVAGEASAEGSDASRVSTESEQMRTTIVCKCSFYEIYNEKVFDLLEGSSSNSSSTASAGAGAQGLQVREDPSRGVFVDGVTEEIVSSPEDAQRALATGYKARHTGSTAMNRESSRSHAVFLLTIETTSGAAGVRRTKSASFSLVDLAGSERQKDTHAEGARLKEATKINKSLLTLGTVIHALSRDDKYIPYRDSTLTFLLSGSLGGNSKTVLVAAISPASDSIEATVNTLKFAQRAKSVVNKVKINVTTTGSLEGLQREIAALRAR